MNIVINFEPGGKVSGEFSDGLKQPKVVPLRYAEAKDFLSKIISIAEKPEILSGLRTVNRHRVEIEWNNFAFIDGKLSGKFSAVSDEWLIDSIEQVLREEQDAQVIEKFRKILESNPHRHALEICSATMNFTRKYRLENQVKQVE